MSVLKLQLSAISQEISNMLSILPINAEVHQGAKYHNVAFEIYSIMFAEIASLDGAIPRTANRNDSLMIEMTHCQSNLDDLVYYLYSGKYAGSFANLV